MMMPMSLLRSNLFYDVQFKDILTNEFENLKDFVVSSLGRFIFIFILKFKKNVWKSDRRWEPENFENLKTWKLENFENIKNDPWDRLNNFCFHVYAQMSLF